MRTVQIYVGREVVDLECVRVTFTLDGQTQVIDVPVTGELNGKPFYSYNLDFSEPDYIVTESGDYITTEDGDYIVTEDSVFTPAIQIFWDGDEWKTQIVVGETTYLYCSSLDIPYPFIDNWEKCDCNCIKVSFTYNGVDYEYTVPKIGITNLKNYYEYIVGDITVIISWVNDYTPSYSWVIQFEDSDVGFDFIAYNSTDTNCPDFDEWIFYSETEVDNLVATECNTLQYLVTEECRDLKYERIELFDDEKINVTLSVQNINDISKTFTDFSQSFTVPGSVVNNRIFEHFYQNDVDGTIDYNLKRKAYIEIDYIPFRKGVIMLEKANVKNGVVDNYSISFFGQLTNLKDIFGEVKINQLDFSSIKFPLTYTNVFNRINDGATDYDIRFPLIAPNRLWTYADGGPNDITVDASTFAYYELFPAVKVARMFDAIEEYFGLTFISDFFEDKRWTKLFMLAKNTNVLDINSINTDLSFDIQDLVFNQIVSSGAIDPSVDPTPSIKFVNNEIWVGFYNNPSNAVRHEITFNLQSISAASDYFIEVYRNGVLHQTVQGSDTNPADFTITILNNAWLGEIYKFKIKATQSVIIEYYITYNIVTLYNSEFVNNFATVSCYPTTLTRSVDPANTLPDMKVADFFSAILKQFNFTCVPLDRTTFKIETLESWYKDGSTIDVTKYIDSESIDVARVPLYRNINFKYQQSESFTNRQYFSFSNQEYGNTNNVFSYDGGDFTIDLPFENLLFSESVGTNPTDVAILGYHINQNYESYTPKPTLLYEYGLATGISPNIKIFDGVSVYGGFAQYVLFGQDITSDGIKYSLNWGADNSIIHKETIQNGLFSTYYFSYLSNLYNLKQRLTTVKSMLPLSILTNLQLNDRLVIRDKRYIINDIKIELTSGEATLTIYNDFRNIELENYTIIDNLAQNVKLRIPYREGNNKATIDITPAGATVSPSTVTWANGDYETKTRTVVVTSTLVSRTFTVTITYINGDKLYYYIIQEV